MSKEIDKLINDINKKHGVNAVQVGDEVVKQKTVKRVPTGSISLDISLGGGLPLGRYIQLEGEFSAGKSTQALHILKNAQKMGLTCVMFDAEDTTTTSYLKQIGVDTNKLLYINPDSLEEVMDICYDLQKSEQVHVALVDSLAVLKPKQALEIGAEDTMRMGVKQQLLDEFFGKFQAYNNRLSREGKTPFTLIATNQLREKIMTMGDPLYAPGGKSKDFYSSVTIRFRRGDWVTKGTGDAKEIIGQVVKYKIEKNKTYKRLQTGEFDFYFAENDVTEVGHNDNFKSIIVESIDWGLIDRGGAWYFLDKGTDKELKFQGAEKLIQHFRDNPKMIDEYKKKILDLAKKVK